MQSELARNALANFSSDVPSAACRAASADWLTRSCFLSAIPHSDIAPSTSSRITSATYAATSAARPADRPSSNRRTATTTRGATDHSTCQAANRRLGQECPSRAPAQMRAGRRIGEQRLVVKVFIVTRRTYFKRRPGPAADLLMPPLAHPTVLVVEDEEELRQTIAESLEASGFVVTQALDGGDATSHLEGFAADALVV